MKSRSGLIFLWFFAVALWVMWLIRRNGVISPTVRIISENKEECRNTEAEKVEPEKKDTSEFCININTATLEELILLPGIGKAIAQDIINYRLEKGTFKKAGDLEQVKGLGPSKLSRIRDLISF